MNTNTLEQGKIFEKAGILQETELVWVKSVAYGDGIGWNKTYTDSRKRATEAIKSDNYYEVEILAPAANCEELGVYLASIGLRVMQEIYSTRDEWDVATKECPCCMGWAFEGIKAKNENEARAQAVEWHLKQKAVNENLR
jgi:hypothetical protein